MGSFGQGLELIIRTVFGLVSLVIILRFLLQVVRADFHNPVSQFIVKSTQPALRPMRRFIPGIAGMDISALVLLLGVTLLEGVLLSGNAGIAPGIGALLTWSIGDMLRLTLNVFFFAILIGIVMSWINPGGYNPVLSIVDSLSRPLLGIARRYIPPIGGLDISPIPVLLGIQLALLWIAYPFIKASGLPF